MRAGGARPRALAIVLVLILGVAAGRRLAWPRAAPESPVAGVDDGVGLRLYPVDEVAARGSTLPACVATPPPVGPGEVLVAHACPPRVRPLPLAARRLLGLPSDVNRLSADDFEQLPGIGPQLARRIVQARAERGGFESVEAVRQVRGVGPAKLGVIRAALNPAKP